MPFIGPLPGTVRCVECGVLFGPGVAHECDLENVIEYQAAVLEKQLNEYLRGVSGANHLEFAAWCREHHR